MAHGERSVRLGAEPGRGGVDGGFLVGSLFGVRVYVDWSVLIVFLLIVVNLGSGLFPSWHPGWTLATSWATACAAALLFFASILAHELSHAVVALKHDIPVPRITLYVFGGVAHMEREPTSPKAEFLMAVVGPLTSIVIGFLAIGAGLALAGERFAQSLADDARAALSTLGPTASLLLWLGPINLVLGVFNLVPGFPLDGGRVFRSIVWWWTHDYKKATRWAAGAGRMFAWILMGLGFMSFMGGALLQGLWLLLIGWFLSHAARTSYLQLVIHESLRDVPLKDVMRTRFARLQPDTGVGRLVREELMASDQRAFPVVGEDDHLLGLVCLEDVRKVPQARWDGTRVSEIMTPVSKLTTLPPDASADEAFQALAQRGVDQIPVLVADRPVGMVRSQDLLKWLSLHLEEGYDRAALGTA